MFHLFLFSWDFLCKTAKYLFHNYIRLNLDSVTDLSLLNQELHSLIAEQSIAHSSDKTRLKKCRTPRWSCSSSLKADSFPGNVPYQKNDINTNHRISSVIILGLIVVNFFCIKLNVKYVHLFWWLILNRWPSRVTIINQPNYSNCKQVLIACAQKENVS